MRRYSITLVVGLILGFAFFAHALVNNSHAWPLIWPLAAGSLAVLLAARRHVLRSFWAGVGVAAKAGTVAGGLFFAATLAALALLSQRSFEPLARAMGADGPISLGQNAVVAIGFAALLGVLLAALAGAVTYPIVRGDRGA